MIKRQQAWFSGQRQDELLSIERKGYCYSENVLPIGLLHFGCASECVFIHSSIHPTTNQIHSRSVRIQLLISFSLPFGKDNWLGETTNKEYYVNYWTEVYNGCWMVQLTCATSPICQNNHYILGWKGLLRGHQKSPWFFPITTQSRLHRRGPKT